ncbi:MAG: hypothetical protein AB1801_22010, partial [Chloroflexota bacterium]
CSFSYSKGGIAMKRINLLLMWLLIGLLVGACDVSTLTLAPAPTATPAVSLGVPTSGGRWQITVKGARQETKLTIGTFLDTTTYTPTKAGYTFLVVDFSFRSLDPSPQTGVPSQAITVISADGEISTVAGIGGSLGDDYVCVEGCSYILKPAAHHLAFLVKEEKIDQSWKLQFPDIAPISFSVDEEAKYPFITEIGNERGRLPAECQVDGGHSLKSIRPLSYTYWDEGGLTLASMVADGSQAKPICEGVALADLQRAVDGAALLRVDPLQGWSNLYAIEPDGGVFVLVKNSPAVVAQFDPTGQYIFFTATKLGEKESEGLYMFDRETASTTLVKAGKWVGFRFLRNGHLLVTVSPTDGGDEEVYLSQADGPSLEPLSLADDIYAYQIAADGQHIVKTKFQGSGEQLIVSELDGSNAQKVVTADWVSGELSPNGQYLLISFMSFLEDTEEFRYKVDLYNLATKYSRTIVQNSPSFDANFSGDSRWVLVYHTAATTDAKAAEETTLSIVSTANGRVVHKIDHAINAVFSPDNTQLAYTIREADGQPTMYVLSLKSGAKQPVGQGVISDWLPVE